MSCICKYMEILKVIKQVRNTIHCVSGHLKHYQSLAQNLTSHFTTFNIFSVPRLQKASVDLLASVASKLIPSQEFSPNRFSIELIFRPSIPDNVTNWRVFNNDADIINSLTSGGTYEEQIIDEHEHDLQINHKQYQNPILKSVVNMEDLYDLKGRFKNITNSKTQSSTLRFEVVNLGSAEKPQNVNLGIGLSSEERISLFKLLKTYKGVFS